MRVIVSTAAANAPFSLWPGQPPRRTDMSTQFSSDVFISEPVAQHVTELVPNADRPMWSPLSTTLIHGLNDATLLDPPFISDPGQAVGDWVTARHNNLTHPFV